MLTEQEQKEIDNHVQHYPTKKAARIEALKVVQQHRGWVSDESIKDIAKYLEISPEDVDSVATYYNLVFRKPIGRNVILICDSVSCYIMEYEKILEHITNSLNIEFGETTEDDRFTLLPIPCLGACDHAPVMMVNEDLHEDLTPEKVDEVLKEYS